MHRCQLGTAELLSPHPFAMALLLRSPTAPFSSFPFPASLAPSDHRLLSLSIVGTFPLSRIRSPLRASRKFGDYHRQESSVVVIPDGRGWREIRSLGEEQEYETEDEEEEEEEDRSLDLLIRFLNNVFRKVSRRARRAIRSVLPVPIPKRLVRFSVNGVLILAFLWILKAFLEVVCTIGSMVFVSILLVRGIWFGFAYLQETRFDRSNRFENDDDVWNGVQPAT